MLSTQQPKSKTATGISVRPSCMSVTLVSCQLKQLDWIEMPFCNARRLALAIQCHIVFDGDLHPRPPEKGQFRWEGFGPL